MYKKFITIVIPLFNAEKYLRETLESVLSQTYSIWECIIVDDGSTDSSKSIAVEYCLKDKRFKYHYQPNSGPSAARNKGLRFSSGDYIQFLDADDVILPQRLELMIELSSGLKDNVILYSNFLCGQNSNIFSTSPFSRPVDIGRDVNFTDMYRKFGVDFLFIPSCVFFKRRALNGINWNEKIDHSEDWDYYLAVLENDLLFRYVHTPLVIYRNTSASLSKNYIETFKANYYILGRWAEKVSFVYVLKRCALLFTKNIFLFLSGKTRVIVKPQLPFRRNSLNFFLFILLLYSYSMFYLVLELLKIMLKKIQRIKNEISVF